ncbi:MAG: DUF1080 domain-containing protein [Planctomycetes bacterium]|nr:DUF1080 domain-containing protein [Planctomycetota bacterium]
MARSLNLKLWICLGGIICLSNNLLAKAFMGEYKGTFFPDKKFTMNATADVVAEGDDSYRIVIDARSDDPAQEGAFIEIYGKKSGSEVTISGRAGGYDWKGEIKDGKLNVRGHYGLHFELKKIESKSPRAGAKPPPNAVILLPYKAGVKPDMSGWTNTQWKALDNGSMQIIPGKGSNRTNKKFSDIKQLHVEFKLPLEPKGRGQGRANSGVYLLDAYEVQVLDSFGIVHTSGDCGGLYNVARAKVNACLPPETWQTYDISFRAARVENGKVKEQPRITVVHNGETIHDNVEIPKRRHRTKGPIQLQDHKHNIEFRNIWLVEGQ